MRGRRGVAGVAGGAQQGAGRGQVLGHRAALGGVVRRVAGGGGRERPTDQDGRLGDLRRGFAAAARVAAGTGVRPGRDPQRLDGVPGGLGRRAAGGPGGGLLGGPQLGLGQPDARALGRGPLGRDDVGGAVDAPGVEGACGHDPGEQGSSRRHAAGHPKQTGGRGGRVPLGALPCGLRLGALARGRLLACLPLRGLGLGSLLPGGRGGGGGGGGPSRRRGRPP